MDFAAVYTRQMRREKQLPLRLSNAEYAALEAEAGSDGRSMAGLIRHVLGSWFMGVPNPPPMNPSAAFREKGSGHAGSGSAGIVPAPQIELDTGEDRGA
jgi:hypothetical protein